MQDLGDKARCPQANKKTKCWKDKSKWCVFHEDFGHIKEDCVALRIEISYLLSQGHLKELLGRNNKRSQDPKRDLNRAESPPLDARIVNFIYGGS